MEQYYRLPQDVVGHDPVLLSYWDKMPPRARLRLLESDISVWIGQTGGIPLGVLQSVFAKKYSFADIRVQGPFSIVRPR